MQVDKKSLTELRSKVSESGADTEGMSGVQMKVLLLVASQVEAHECQPQAATNFKQTLRSIAGLKTTKSKAAEALSAASTAQSAAEHLHKRNARLRFVQSDALFCNFLQRMELLQLPFWKELLAAANFAVKSYISDNCQADIVDLDDDAVTQIAYAVIANLHFGMTDRALCTGAASHRADNTDTIGSKVSRAADHQRKRTLTLDTVKDCIHRLVRQLVHGLKGNTAEWQAFQRLSLIWQRSTSVADNLYADAYRSKTAAAGEALVDVARDLQIDPWPAAKIISHFASKLSLMAGELPSSERDANKQRKAAQKKQKMEERRREEELLQEVFKMAAQVNSARTKEIQDERR